MRNVFYFLFLTLLIACQKDAINSNDLDQDSTWVDVRTSGGGNATCEDAATKCNVTFSESSGRLNYDASTGQFDGDFPAGFTISTDGTNVSWSYEPTSGMCLANVAFIVKGGPANNIYCFTGANSGDSMHSPINASGNPAGLSNLTICYNLEPCHVECQEETAYGGDAAGPNGRGRGCNSAWWYYYSGSGAQSIWAGQNQDAGTVELAGGEFTITLTNEWELAEGGETVKILGLSTLGCGRPIPGTSQYKGNSLSVTVGVHNFYAIHLDIRRCN